MANEKVVALPHDLEKPPTLELVDSWLDHAAAAEYLGVGRSTLYRYAEHQEVESRKFCGRLQYRHYQLGMAEQVRKAVEKTNKRLYGRRAPLHFRDSSLRKEQEEKIAVCK